MATNSLNCLLLLPVVILSLFKLFNVSDASIRYDQRQFGDYNVQIHLKNMELYAILDEGILNSEYDYDYSELTEKPSSTTKVGPHQWQSVNSTTTKPAIFSQIPSSHVNSSITNNNNSLSSINSSALMITDQLLMAPPSQHANTTFVADHDSSTMVKIRKCALGYYRDNLGRCRRLRKPHLPFLQMVHSPGVIKSFQHSPEVTTPATNSENNTS